MSGDMNHSSSTNNMEAINMQQQIETIAPVVVGWKQKHDVMNKNKSHPEIALYIYTQGF